MQPWYQVQYLVGRLPISAGETGRDDFGRHFHGAEFGQSRDFGNQRRSVTTGASANGSLNFSSEYTWLGDRSHAFDISSVYM